VSLSRLIALLAVALSASILLAPPTLADSAANVKYAVASARRETSCGQLRYNPIVEQAASVITRLNDDYVNHTAQEEPVENALPGLKDLGYNGNKAKLLQGTAKKDADAIKSMILEGYEAIPDCSYTDFGVNLRRNETTGYTFATTVLAGA
jgi:hypothetical protein